MGGHRDSAAPAGPATPRQAASGGRWGGGGGGCRAAWRWLGEAGCGARRAAMARWLRDRLLFRSAKPAPPQPDYTPPPPPPGPPEQPDLLAAYRLQRERDFEDPYAAPRTTSSAAAAPSPRRRLIRLEEAAETEPGERPPLEKVCSPPPKTNNGVCSGREGVLRRFARQDSSGVSAIVPTGDCLLPGGRASLGECPKLASQARGPFISE